MADGAKSGLASGTSGSPQLTLENEEMSVQASKNEAKLNLPITNKFPNDNQHGKKYDFTISNGRIKLVNGFRTANFVIDEEGKLLLGEGHSFLANGKSVLAAGTLKINKQGCVRRIVNDSGHYQPTPAEAIRFPKLLERSGLNVNNAWIEILRFSTTKSNYVKKVETLYNGPVKYLWRRLK